MEENTIVFCQSQDAGKHSAARVQTRNDSSDSDSDSKRQQRDRQRRRLGLLAHEDVVVVAVDLYGRGVGRHPVLHVIEIEVRLAKPAAVHHHLVT